MVPKPVCAVLLLFPVTEKYESFRLEEENKIKAQGQEQHLEFEADSALKKFLVESTKLSPEDKANFLEKDESIRVTHESSAQEGQTEAPSIDEKVDLHFIAFVNVGGDLYELDGRKPFPIAHGATSEDTFLGDATKVCKKFMDRDPGELRFTVVALSKT
ncbi:hypothetical protein UPYG_G00319210 [Umbra pygmaea]|uniref:ubiquitinyl hydrolase 1 n=1 Tax=Umbra pygmaea TaxID=75934 RepID=A0ABD0WIP6_UMBPY